ncbi:MAG: UvrD-helicase domain-containing protein, partial [Actinomycetota bacterium]|nr:UvrD-helicase domain-containing protein [Actinomycetota bacterium]
MASPSDSSGDPSDPQAAVVSHREGALLVLGVAGAGRTEALALTCSHSPAGDLRTRAEEAASEPFEELAVHPHRVAAVRLLREHSTEAGVDPLLESFNPAERLAMLLDRVDELPLRRHAIRGNAAGLLARLVGRIDALKAAAVTPERFRSWTDELTREAADDAERDSAEREREFAELYAIHDSILFESGATDGGSAVMELTRLLVERPALAAAISERYPHLIVDELEDACPAERELIARLAKGSRTAVLSCDDEQGRARCGSGAAWARAALGEPAEVGFETSWRYGGELLDAAHAVLAPISGREGTGTRRAAGPETEVAFWSAANERAEVQAVAREVESALAAGDLRPGR